MAASLNDSAILGANTAFIGRGQASLLAACVAIANEGIAVLNHPARLNFIHQTVANPTTLANAAQEFALAVATDASVLADATQSGTVALTTANILAQQALVTDAHINSAVSGMFNTFVQGIVA